MKKRINKSVNVKDVFFHCIIEDLIDIDPDRSKKILYCTKCYKTFDSLTSKSFCLPAQY
jgi:hypothetical protein